MKPTHKPYAIIEKDGAITRYDGTLVKFRSLAWLQEFYKQQTSDIIFLTPFCTIRERWFMAHGQEPILAIQISHATSLTREQIDATLSDKEITFDTPIAPIQDDETFAAKVREIQEHEIGWGNICQMILSQPYIGKIRDFSQRDVESAFRNALQQRGQYMTVLIDDGEGNSFVSLTPEQHLEVTDSTVTMNPIAGTLKKWETLEGFRSNLLNFLEDIKEKNELFQVLDEELKMMEAICEDGGRIEWPFLRQNGAVIHTEYKLIGKRNPDIEPLDALRETLHAPTLVGWPIESAARLIERYEDRSRRYYGGEVGILTADGHLDTAIMIRSAHFQADGTVTIQAGAGVTKKSKPMDEAREVALKTWGMRSALTGGSKMPLDVQSILDEPEIIAKLQERNKHLSKFHFVEQSNQESCEQLKWKTATIIDNEDNFTRMIARMMTTMGMIIDIVKTAGFDPTTNTSDIVVIWPGPGDINDMGDVKIRTLAKHTEELIKQKRNLLGICLGHQVIAKKMWLSVQRMIEPKQWQQWEVYINKTSERVGFYNSFVPIFHKNSGYMDAGNNHYPLQVIQKNNISGFQFHPESVMSQNGYEILRDELIRILGVEIQKNSEAAQDYVPYNFFT
jgi:phenazine biosynthesis protein phzE